MIIHEVFQGCIAERERLYSDLGVYITRDDLLYKDVIVPVGDRPFEETDIPIEEDDDLETKEYAEAGKILLGVKE